MAKMTHQPTTASEPMELVVSDLRIGARAQERAVTLVAGVDLSVSPGESVAIVGESGSGKSMTARSLLGLLPPGVFASGTATYRGKSLLGLRESALRGIRGSEIAILFQDPYTMLNPLRRTRNHIEEVLGRNGQSLSRAQRRVEALRRLAEVGIRDASVAERYPFELSGGMRQRVALAAALAQDPAILIADEPSTALDVSTQREILALLASLQQARAMGLVLITHDLRVAFSTCDRVYVFYAGSVLEQGHGEGVRAEPLHPYTLGLLLSDPPVDHRVARLPDIPGAVPAPDEVSGMCAFAPRCRWAADVCLEAKPPLAEVSPGRYSACIRLDAIRPAMALARHEIELSEAIEHAHPGNTIVCVRGLTKVFGSGLGRRQANDHVALSEVSLEIGANESIGLVGESGSGKTTLARCLVGLETPTDGKILIADTDASDYKALSSQDRRRLRSTIQMVFQDPYSSLNPAKTVGNTLKEAVAAGDELSPRGSTAVDELLAQVGLPVAYAKRRPGKLSGGERQRVAIARALAMNPRILVCDEPVSALDSSIQAQILNLFRSLQSEFGLSYLFISHDLAVIRQVADRVYVLYRGAIVEAGPVDEVLLRPQHWYTRELINAIPDATSILVPKPKPGLTQAPNQKGNTT